MTFVSLRKHHPDSEIELYVSEKSDKKISWGNEAQDFQTKGSGKCYLDKLEDLDVKVIRREMFPTYAPNYQSDLFRWWWLNKNGGFYLDTDQIILKPFNTLPLEYDLIYSMYQAKSCGVYSPVGVIGANKGCKAVKDIIKKMPECYKPNDYNSLGPFMFRELYFKNRDKWDKENRLFNSPPHFFYPVPESGYMSRVYESPMHITGDSYAFHWFGGHPKSQIFNRELTEGNVLERNNTISELAKPLLLYMDGLR